MVRITTTNHGVIECSQDFRRIQSSIKNNQFIEINSMGTKFFINPEHIVSVESTEPEIETKLRYGRVNTMPITMTAEETEIAQNKMQPMKILFDIKRKATEEMLEKENIAKNATLDTAYGRYRQGLEKGVAVKIDDKQLYNSLSAANNPPPDASKSLPETPGSTIASVEGETTAEINNELISCDFSKEITGSLMDKIKNVVGRPKKVV